VCFEKHKESSLFLTNKFGKILFFTGLLITAIAAALYIAACTHLGPWGYSDTAVYYASARNLANGIGVGTFNLDGSFSRLRIFAPFFSIILSLFARPEFDLIEINRILDILFYAILVFSSGWLFYRISSSSILGLCFSILLGFTQDFSLIFSSMMSEPLAFMLGIPSLLLVILSVKERSFKHLVIAGILGGLAFFSRYAFIAIPISGVLILLILSRKPWKKRAIDVLTYSILAFSPMLGWLAFELLNNQTIGARSFNLDFEIKGRIIALFNGLYEMINSWFPYRPNLFPGVRSNYFYPILLVVILFLIILAFIPTLRKRVNKEDGNSVYLLIDGSCIYLLVYFLIFFATFVFTPNQIPINQRLLSPLIPGCYLVLLSTSLNFHKVIRIKNAIPIVGLFMSLFFVYFNFSLLVQYLTDSQNPRSYSSPELRYNQIFEIISNLPEDTKIITNIPDILLFYTNKNSYYLGSDLKSEGFFIDIGDKERINGIVSTECGIFVLLEPDIAIQYENRPSPIGLQEYEEIQAQYKPIFQNESGVLLSAQNCGN
jgi:hypothetical protein